MPKTWGPFSGSQLTVPLIALIAATVPGTLKAVDAYTNVAIEDPFNGRKALLDSARRLIVEDSVAVYENYPGYFFRTRILDVPTSCTKVAAAPAGKALIVKSVTVNTSVIDTPGASRYVALYTGQFGCTSVVLVSNPGGVGTVALPSEPGIIVPAGQSLWAFVGIGTLHLDAYFTGYTVPAGWAPSGGGIITASPASASETVVQGASQ